MSKRPAQQELRDASSSLDPIREAIESGIDVAMLRANLALSPTERVRRHQIALNTAEMLRKARRP